MIVYHVPQAKRLALAGTYRTLCSELCSSGNKPIDMITQLSYTFFHEAMGQSTDKGVPGEVRVDSGTIWRIGRCHEGLHHALRESQKDTEQNPEATSGLSRRKTEKKEVNG